MGICCSDEETTIGAAAQENAKGNKMSKGEKAPKAPPAPVVEQIKDLPVVKWEGIKDLYERFEKSLPFNRIKVEQMITKIEEAEKKALANDGGQLAEGVKPYVTLQSLRQALPTDAWRDLLDR